jgi:uncharacterized protein (UPF0276 family)
MHFLDGHSDTVDYVEVPFELLRHDPAAAGVIDRKPVVLHCASLSIAGSVPPSPAIVKDVQTWIDRTRTPWLGEHLSFITAERDLADNLGDAYAPGEPWNIGYTVSPPLNLATVELVLRSLAQAQCKFDVPLLVENPPIYFSMPGSTMSQVDFISEMCAQSEVLLLLDLAHFYITAQTLQYDPFTEIVRLPLDRVVEVHLSGVDTEAGGRWDNHASRAPQVELDLLALVLDRSPVRAVTLEYNWSSRFPESVMLDEIARARRLVDCYQTT